MSVLYPAYEILKLSSNIVGRSGPIKIDSGVYEHNLFLEEHEKLCDVRVLGEVGRKVTFDELINLLSELNNIIDNFNDGRSFCFEGIYKISDNHFAFEWGS